MTRRLTLALAVSTALLGGATACSADAASDSSKLDVVAAFYPLQFVAQRVGGDHVGVVNLVKPGVEPHDLELTAGQVRNIADGDVIIYLGGFQPAVDDAVQEHGAGRAFDAATIEPLQPGAEEDHEGEEGHETEEPGHEESGLDPHVWLDPTRLATIADRFADRLAEADPAHAADYRSGAASLRTDLEALDHEYAAALATCQRREIVTSHAAFGYLAARYRLTQVAITGITPEDEPTAQRLAGVVAEAKRTGATTIFFETLVSPAVADTIAREVGAKTAVLDPIEGLAEGGGGDYLSVMRSNLATLVAALDCS